jgi:hypothetical protein
MAIVASANLGNNHTDNSQAAIAFNTNALVPGGSWLIVLSAWWIGSNPSLTVSGGGLTWVNDLSFGSGSPHVGVSRAFVPSDLALGTTLTRTMGSATNANYISALYMTGADPSSPLTGGTGSASGSTAAFTCGSITPGVANSLVLGVNFSDAGASGTTSNPGGFTEIVDINEALPAGTAFTGLYGIASGATNPGGTWSNAGAWVGGSVAYKPDLSLGSVPDYTQRPMFFNIPSLRVPGFWTPTPDAPAAPVVGARRRRTLFGVGR